MVLDALLWLDRTGAPWRDLPERFGPWRSVATRFYRWTRSGLWDRVLAALRQRKADAGELDGRLYSIDGSVVRAHVAAAGASKKNARPANRPTTPSAAARVGSGPKST